ncbi:hypothetical protein M3Y97_00694600 [Aphelenchoides bicaudatus]|nr:hypothetical protein M3Y97_00694600 [Aphelenchoides bicaudatus]
MNSNYWLRYISLIVLVVQNTSQVLLMRYASKRDQPQFLKTVAVFWNEVLKAGCSHNFVCYFYWIAWRHHFIDDWFDTLKVAVPALIYTIQNFLLYVAIDNLEAPVYMVTYQLKILTTAIFTVLMMKRRLSIVQWVSLCVLIAGVAIVQIDADNAKKATSNNSTSNIGSLLTTTIAPTTTVDPNNAPTKDSIWIGLISVITACIMSGFAGIYFEKILKGSNVSIWLRNIQLAVLALPISLIIVAIKDHKAVADKGFMQGFDIIVWCVIAIQTFGGLLIAVVIKYADNILKAFATSVAIIVSAIASIFIFNTYPQLLFIVGAILVIGAVILYSVFPYRAPKVVEEEKPKIDIEENGNVDGVDLEEATNETAKVEEENKEKI